MALVDHFLKTLKKFFLPSGSQKRRQRPVSKKKKAVKRPVKPLKRKRASGVGKKKAVHSVSASFKKRVSEKKAVKRSAGGSKTSSGGPKEKLKKRPAGSSTKKKNQPQSSGVLVGEITHYFTKIQVCVLKVTGKTLLINDRIFIRGKSTDFQQTVRSMQVESLDVKVAKKGQLVGLKVDKIVKIGDKVYKD